MSFDMAGEKWLRSFSIERIVVFGMLMVGMAAVGLDFCVSTCEDGHYCPMFMATESLSSNCVCEREFPTVSQRIPALMGCPPHQMNLWP